MRFIDAIPWPALLIVAVLLALAPFGSTPHLVEKWRMLFAGTLRRGIDWFDLVLHTAPIALLLIKAALMLRR